MRFRIHTKLKALQGEDGGGCEHYQVNRLKRNVPLYIGVHVRNNPAQFDEACLRPPRAYRLSAK